MKRWRCGGSEGVQGGGKADDEPLRILVLHQRSESLQYNPVSTVLSITAGLVIVLFTRPDTRFPENLALARFLDIPGMPVVKQEK